jgi:hypothetical protein
MPKPKKKTISSRELPPVEPDNFTVVLSKDEITSLVQLLAFSRDVFAQMALNLLKEGNDADSQTISARSVLSNILCTKFKDVAVIGEPESRQLH